MAGVGTPRRLSYGALAAGIGGIVLIVSLFLDWFSAGGFSQTGWETFKFTDIVLLVLGLLALGYALVELTGAAANMRFSRERALTIIGIIATTLTLELLIEGDNQAVGLILAVLASLAILAGGLLAENRPQLAVDLGGGPRAAGAPGAQPGYGAPPTQQMPPAGGGYGQPPAQQPPPAAAPPVQQQAPPPAADPQATSIGQVQPPPQPASPPPPPGGTADWYPDPHGQKRLRYYDGTQWTEHTAD
jgi:hypothetical protein